MKNKILHIVLVFFLVILLFLLTDYFMWWMPQAIVMITLLAVTVLICLWSGFVIMERGGDERETLHKMNAGRVAYLAGLAILTIALIVQTLTLKSIDIWIALTLGVMIVSKLGARIYFDLHK